MRSVNQFLLALVTASALTACGGGGGGDSTTGGGTTGGGSTNISLPSNAITLDETNAAPVAQSSITYIDLGYAAFGVDAQPIPPAHQVINTVKDIVFNNEARKYTVVTAAETFSDDCTGGGSYSDTWTETNTSWTGTVTFNNCNQGGVVLHGSLNYSESWDDVSGAYSGSANGTITVTFGGESFTMALNISETGNDNSGDYSVTISYSVSGSNIGGWLVQTESPIVGNTNGAYNSGVLIITGANNTKVRVTIVPFTTATVELDTGSGYVEVPESPITL